MLEHFDEDALRVVLFSRALLLATEDEQEWQFNFAMPREIPLQDKAMSVDAFTDRLWEALMDPVHERLLEQGVSKGALVTLMPQGELGLLPLHAATHLVDEVKRAFLDDYTVTYAPSAYTRSISLRRLQDRRHYAPSFLIVVNPAADLPYTSFESEAVAALFSPTMQCVLVGNDATQEAVLSEARGKSYLHFTCHGFYDWQDVLHSELNLASDHPFTLAEIVSPRFDLSAALLVTLSACESGLSELRHTPNEYIDLSAGFLQAGAPAVVSSLWVVDDLSSALLMEDFYRRHLLQGQT